MVKGGTEVAAVDLRYFGESSGIRFVRTAIELKQQYHGGGEISKASFLSTRRIEYWEPQPVSTFLPISQICYKYIIQWENISPPEEVIVYTFPEPDLMTSLIDLYFTVRNVFLPLLHRPTFEREIAEGKHLWHVGFGGTVLLVCALASRISNDPRVILPETGTARSSGWKYFEQVHTIRSYYLASPSLYDLQNYCVSGLLFLMRISEFWVSVQLGAMFLQGGSKPQMCWSMCGIGIRLAQDLGANRRKMYPVTKRPTVDDELWKRTLWWVIRIQLLHIKEFITFSRVLIGLDRSISSALGRSCAIQDEGWGSFICLLGDTCSSTFSSFDIDFPLEVDDEYWENPLDPERAFVQPPNKPSTSSFFVSYSKLSQILGFILRTIVSVVPPN